MILLQICSLVLQKRRLCQVKIHLIAEQKPVWNENKGVGQQKHDEEAGSVLKGEGMIYGRGKDKGEGMGGLMDRWTYLAFNTDQKSLR